MTEQQNSMSFEEWLNEVKRLRSLSAAAEADFLSLVQWGEDKWDTDVPWRAGGGYANFSDLLAQTNLVDPKRYTKFKDAVGIFGLDKVRANGVEPMTDLLKIPEEAVSKEDPTILARDAVLQGYEAFSERNNTAISPRTAKAEQRRHYEPPVRHRTPAEVKIQALEEDNKNLRKQLAAANREIARLQKLVGDRAVEQHANP